MSDASASPGTIPAPMPRTRPGAFAVGVDGSPGSMAALDWAVAGARLRGAAVQAVIVGERITGPGATNGWAIGVGGTPDVTDPVLARAVAEVTRLGEDAVKGSGVRISCEEIEGHPALVLVRCAQDAGALVVGSRGQGGFTGAVLGPVSQHVVAHARCRSSSYPTPTAAIGRS